MIKIATDKPELTRIIKFNVILYLVSSIKIKIAGAMNAIKKYKTDIPKI